MTCYVRDINIQVPEVFASLALRRLGELTILLGKNGSGKSVALRAWRDTDVENVHYVAPERTGSFNFNPNLVQAELTASGRRGGGIRNIEPHYHERSLGRVAAYFMKRGASKGPLPRTDAEEIEATLGGLLPGFRVRLQASDPPILVTRVSDGNIVHTVEDLSSGESQLLTLAVDILTIAGIWELDNKFKRILLVDEPDTHIHPDLQLRFAELLLLATEKYALQVVVATHSTTMMAALAQVWAGRDVRVAFLRQGCHEFDAHAVDSVRQELATCLGGHVLMGALFGSPLLLVEGVDDFAIWSQAARHQACQCAVLPCRGEQIKTYQKRLEEIFASLQEASGKPVGYALLDGDKPVPEPNPDNRQNFVRFLGLSCHEAENLYLTDEVLALLDYDWRGAVAKIEQQSRGFGEKAEKLAAAGTWDRRNADIKNVIGEVAAILDPKGVPWTVRLGSALERARPQGQLAEFLGETLITALYSPMGT